MNTRRPKGLRVVALLDGRPGHEKQTMGLIQALQTMVDVRVTWIYIEHQTVFNMLWQAWHLFCVRKGMEHPEIERPDFLIGTGSRTHLLLLLYKKRYRAPALTCMTPALYLRSYFDICFVPVHDGLKEQENILLTLGAPNCSQNRRSHQQGSGLILLGGLDRKSHRWDDLQVVGMIERVVQADSDKSWTISSSPRTPQRTIDLTRTLVKKYDHVCFFDYKDTQPRWIDDQYDKNSVVWVTADSISMIYEALTAGCRVGIFPMQWTRRNCKFRRNEEALLENGLAISFTDWGRNNATWSGKKIDFNEAQRCSQRILQRWRIINSQ